MANYWHAFIGWSFSSVSSYLVLTFLLGITIVVKIVHLKNSFFRSLPESCILILFGIAIGVVFNILGIQSTLPEFTPELFNFILLPAIVLDSSYELDHPKFFENLGTIVTYAVIGTALNIILVCLFIFVSQNMGLILTEIPGAEIFLFSVIVSAVDPVAVLSVFQEVNVNKALYFLVFGESLLNDAVVLTAYERVKDFLKVPIIQAVDVFVAFISFLTCSLLGIIVGLIFGLLGIKVISSAWSKALRLAEPLIIIGIAYISYLVASAFQFSGLLSIIACGLVQSQIAKRKMSSTSLEHVGYLTKISATMAESIVFILFGLVLVSIEYEWDTSFSLWSLFYIILSRFIVTFILTYVANSFFQRIRIVNFREQIVMAYGGLRGAIAFFLSNLLSEKQPLTNEPLVGAHKLFLTTTLFIILFTVLILGTTTKPLVRILGVKSQTETGVRGFIKLNMDAAFVVMQGIEILTSQRANIDIVRRISNATEAMKKKIKKVRKRSSLRFETRTTDTDHEKTIIKIEDKGSEKRRKLRIKSQFSERSESYEYPDLDKRISINELLDGEGNLFFPKLEEDNLSTLRPRNWRIILHKISREFCIPVEFRDIFSTNLQ